MCISAPDCWPPAKRLRRYLTQYNFKTPLGNLTNQDAEPSGLRHRPWKEAVPSLLEELAFLMPSLPSGKRGSLGFLGNIGI